MVDVTTLPGFNSGPRPGTVQSCGHHNRLEYILVSAAHVTGGAIERRGLWGTPTNKNPPSDWAIYPEGLRRVETLPLFTAGLLGRGFTEDEAAAILGGNALRVLRRVLPAG